MNAQDRILLIPILMEANTRIQQLRATLNEHNYNYYVLASSPLSDAEYDQLYFELVELEKKYPQFADSTSPTQRIGAPTKAGFKKVRHAKRMLSLDNMRTAADVIRYLGKEEVVLEPKIDGASLELIYVKGRLVQAITRGDGTEGDDVTANARAINNIPLVLSKKINLTVRGEVYMSYTAFNLLNTRFETAGIELMANPRNAAAGTLKLKDPKEVSARGLRFVAYDVLEELDFTQHTLMEHLATLRFENVSLLPVIQSCQSVADCFEIESEAYLERRIAEADITRKFLDLPTDGLVFKLNDRRKQRELGEGNKYPKWGCAFKFPAERKETKLNAITIQIGRTGRVTPVAELEPVLLSGTMVRRASLCNQDEIDRLKINIGDTVFVEKSAEIIPKVVGLAKKGSKSVYLLPDLCPCCQTKLENPEGFVDSFCPNKECPDQVAATLLHGCGKGSLDIDGCGETLVQELMNHGVKKLSDVFTVDPSFMKTAARKRFEAGRKAAVDQPLWRKLHALGIEGFGTTLSKEVGQRWKNIVDALEEVEEIDEVETRPFLDMVGPVVYNNVLDYLTANAQEYEALDRLIGMTGTGQIEGALTGMTFCITGDLMSGTRNEVSKRIEEAGGVVKSSVSRHLNYLIQGTETGKKKRDEAEKHGVPIITETQLFELMGQEMPTPKDVAIKEY